MEVYKSSLGCAASYSDVCKSKVRKHVQVAVVGGNFAANGTLYVGDSRVAFQFFSTEYIDFIVPALPGPQQPVRFVASDGTPSVSNGTLTIPLVLSSISQVKCCSTPHPTFQGRFAEKFDHPGDDSVLGMHDRD
jgi:hypothetical protein